MQTTNFSLTKRSQAGFSLIEIIIAMALMIVILGSVFSLMSGSLLSSSANYEMTQVQQELRFAQEYIARDLLSAGDGVGGAQKIWLRREFVETYLTSQNWTTLRDTDLANTTFLVMSGIVSDNNVGVNKEIKDFAGNSYSPARYVLNVSTPAYASDRLTIISTNPDFLSVQLPMDMTNASGTKSPIKAALSQVIVPTSVFTVSAVGDIYYLTNGSFSCFVAVTSKSGGRLTFDRDDTLDPLGINGTPATSPLVSIAGLVTNPPQITIQKMRIINYFVDNNHVLTRRVFGDGPAGSLPARDDVIATNVTKLDFLYSRVLSGASGTPNSRVYEPLIASLDSKIDRDAVRLVQPIIEIQTSRELQDGQRQKAELSTRINVRNLPFGLAPVPIDIEGTVPDLPTATSTATNTSTPTDSPTETATSTPTDTPSATGTATATATPTDSPTATGTATPTDTPSPTPTSTPTDTPSPTPTSTPTDTPSPTPTSTATATPTTAPTPDIDRMYR